MMARGPTGLVMRISAAGAVQPCRVWLVATTLAAGVPSQPAEPATGQVVVGDSALSGFAASTLQRGAVLVYRRDGGLLPATAAVQEWALFSDGRVQGSSGEDFRIDARAVGDLLATVTNLDVDHTGVRCGDCYTYHIEIRRESTVERLTVVEGGTGLPSDFIPRMGHDSCGHRRRAQRIGWRLPECPDHTTTRAPRWSALVPPHMVEAMKLRGNDNVKRLAAQLDEESVRFRTEREGAAPATAFMDAPTVAAGAALPTVNREVYDAQNGSTLPGSLVRSEGSPPGSDTEVNNAYDGAGDVHDLYLQEFNRDGRIPDFPVTRSHPPASWPSAANSSICRTYRKAAGEESRRRSPVANRWMRP